MWQCLPSGDRKRQVNAPEPAALIHAPWGFPEGPTGHGYQRGSRHPAKLEGQVGNT